MLTLIGCRLPCRNDSDDIPAGTLAVAHGQDPQHIAQAKRNARHEVPIWSAA